MKTTLLSIFAFAVAIGSLLGEDQDQEQDQVKPSRSRESVALAAPRQVNAAPRVIPQAPQVQRNVNVTPRFQPRVNSDVPNRVYTPRVQAPVRTFTPPDQDAPRPTTTLRSDVNLQNREWRTRVRDSDSTVIAPRPTQTPPTTVQSNTTVQNRDWRNRTDQNRNWQNNNSSGTWSYEEACRHRYRDHHHRDWWRSHFTRFALFGGGYYYWDNNYWYPAYGYDPYYSTYSYDQPIYGYQDWDPGQVIASVQTELQRLGYYRYVVDGLMGPATRAALARFQRDNGLVITAAIDRPTLRSLRLG